MARSTYTYILSQQWQVKMDEEIPVLTRAFVFILSLTSCKRSVFPAYTEGDHHDNSAADTWNGNKHGHQSTATKYTNTQVLYSIYFTIFKYNVELSLFESVDLHQHFLKC